MISYR